MDVWLFCDFGKKLPTSLSLFAYYTNIDRGRHQLYDAHHYAAVSVAGLFERLLKTDIHRFCSSGMGPD